LSQSESPFSMQTPAVLGGKSLTFDNENRILFRLISYHAKTLQ